LFTDALHVCEKFGEIDERLVIGPSEGVRVMKASATMAFDSLAQFLKQIFECASTANLSLFVIIRSGSEIAVLGGKEGEPMYSCLHVHNDDVSYFYPLEGSSLLLVEFLKSRFDLKMTPKGAMYEWEATLVMHIEDLKVS